MADRPLTLARKATDKRYFIFQSSFHPGFETVFTIDLLICSASDNPGFHAKFRCEEKENLTRLSLGLLKILLGIRLAMAKLLQLSCVQLGAVTSSVAVKVSQTHNP